MLKVNIKNSFEIENKTINIIAGDIVDMEADCIVSSDDNYLTMSGGVSLAIKQAGGNIIWDESRQFIPSGLCKVHVTESGLLKSKYVFHAIVIDFDEGILPDSKVIEQTVINILEEANRRGCASIALPALGTGSGVLASSICAISLVNTLFQHIGNYDSIAAVNIVLFREDTHFEFYKSAIDNQFRMKIAELEKEKIELSKQLSAIKSYKRFPFQLAHLKRKVDTEIIGHSKFTSHLDFYEHTLKYLSIIVIGYLYYRMDSPEERKHVVQIFYQKDPPGFGAWKYEFEYFLRKYQDVLAEHEITRAILDFYQGDIPKIVSKILKMRNNVRGHGVTRNEEYYKGINEELNPTLDYFFNELSFVNKFTPIVVKEIDFLSETDDVYVYKLKKLTGDNFVFETITFTSKIRLRKDRIYLLDSKQENYIKLFPFMLFESCPQCVIAQPFYLEMIRKKSYYYGKQIGSHKIKKDGVCDW